MACEFCDNPNNKFAELKFKDYEHWTVCLHPRQYYLGRCAIFLKRHSEDFFDVNKEELKEFYEITRNLTDALKELFGADMLNYAILGNIIRHIHLHVIPRYSKEVEFMGVKFKDERWGQNYAPYDKSFEIPKEIKIEICDKIRSRL